MKYTKEEILNALEIIHNICNDTEGCKSCPFSNHYEECIIAISPCDWKIKERTEIWKAFD